MENKVWAKKNTLAFSSISPEPEVALYLLYYYEKETTIPFCTYKYHFCIFFVSWVITENVQRRIYKNTKKIVQSFISHCKLDREARYDQNEFYRSCSPWNIDIICRLQIEGTLTRSWDQSQWRKSMLLFLVKYNSFTIVYTVLLKT